MDLADLRTAKCEAVRFASEAICDETGTFWGSAESTLTVSDDQELILFQLLVLGTESAAGSAPKP